MLWVQQLFLSDSQLTVVVFFPFAYLSKEFGFCEFSPLVGAVVFPQAPVRVKVVPDCPEPWPRGVFGPSAAICDVYPAFTTGPPERKDNLVCGSRIHRPGFTDIGYHGNKLKTAGKIRPSEIPFQPLLTGKVGCSIAQCVLVGYVWFGVPTHISASSPQYTGRKVSCQEYLYHRTLSVYPSGCTLQFFTASANSFPRFASQYFRSVASS